MPRLRASWIIVLAVIAALVAAPPLREQVRGGRSSWALYRQIVATSMVRPGEEEIAPYRQHALSFVERYYPEDAEMLAAAGHLSSNRELGAFRLWLATQRSRSPIFHAAYVSVLMSVGPRYLRLGRWVADPLDAEEVTRARQRLAEVGLPDRLDPAAAATLLETLHGWEACDPDNGMPHALAAYYLYGLHRDNEARREWERAGQLPAARDYRWPLAACEAHLLNRMGMPQADAVWCSLRAMRSWPKSTLDTMARYASYEGRLAQLRGRTDEAVQWWNGTLGLGRHLQASSDTTSGFVLGVALEQIGAAPTWQLYQRGFPPSLLTVRRGGKLYYGPAHDAYVSQAGPGADTAVRDRLLTALRREELLRRQEGPLASTDSLVSAIRLQAFAGLVASLAGWCLGLFLLASLSARRSADAAASPGSVWPVLTVALPPAFVLAAAVWALQYDPNGTGEHTLAGWISQGGFAVALAAVCAVPLLRATCWPPADTELLLIWRGNLRRALPALIAVSVLVYLGLQITAAKLRADWLHVWARPGITEMSVLTHGMGSEWEHPALPPGAWRAEYPSPARRGGWDAFLAGIGRGRGLVKVGGRSAASRGHE